MPKAGRIGASTVSARGVRGLSRLALGGLVVLVSALLWAMPAGAEELKDFSGGAFQILAPGEEGGLAPGPFSGDQAALYDALTPLKKVSMKKIEEDYVSEKFGVQGAVMSKEEPIAGLKIERDSHDIPHVFGETRGDVMFGSGWLAAQDRALLLALGLGPAFAAAIDVPGVNPFGLLLNQRSFTPSVEGFTFVAEQEKVFAEQGAKGLRTKEDLESWVEGINAYEASLGSKRILPPLTLPSAIAGFAFIGSIFGNGGGGEVGNSQFLANLESKFGPEEGLKVFHDLREVNDAEAPTTARKSFPYDGVPSGATPGAVVIDPGSVSSAAKKAASALTASRRRMSNFLVVGGQNTANGHPLAVMGPQLGYFYPEIVFQGDLHGPGIDAQGIIAPISPYVFIGRGQDFAWSLTSADSENVQLFAEQLCNPDEETEGAPTRSSTHYMYKGECIPFHEFDAGTLGAGEGEPEREVRFNESVHGPIQGTVTVKGKFYAIAKDRSTRGREPAGELAFSELDSDEVHNPQEFFEAANHLETTFNMSYLDSKHIAYFSAGRLPVLAEGTDPSLPTLGTGEYDWTGKFLSLEQHPHEVDPVGGNPANDVFTNWNNKPAPGWGAASDNYGYGPVHRVQLYKGFGPGMTEASDVTIMNHAATQDLRAVSTWPTIEKVLAGEPAPSKLAEEGEKLVSEWTAKGASRLGLGRPKAHAAAVMDKIWLPIGEAVLGPALGTLLPELASLAPPDDPPSSGGSAYGAGWEGYVLKDLRTVLGEPVSEPYSRGYCGSGSLSACRASLWAAIQKGMEALVAEQGGESSKWRAASVRIAFPPDPLFHGTMRWTNRSTFQQVIEFTGHGAEE
jgi:acyl-homoserine lactone acylase PvdQ